MHRKTRVLLRLKLWLCLYFQAIIGLFCFKIKTVFRSASNLLFVCKVYQISYFLWDVSTVQVLFDIYPIQWSTSMQTDFACALCKSSHIYDMSLTIARKMGKGLMWRNHRTQDGGRGWCGVVEGGGMVVVVYTSSHLTHPNFACHDETWDCLPYLNLHIEFDPQMVERGALM